MKRPDETRRRVLLIDDNADMHAYFQRALEDVAAGRDASGHGSLDDMESFLFGAPAPRGRAARFDFTSAYGGEEGYQSVAEARREGDPYALVFVDMRMPPGWDGLETLRRIWAEDPDVQTVLCTAYMDYSWEQITSALDRSDRLLILKKPFETIELVQMALAMTEKWSQEAARRRADAGSHALLGAIPDMALRVDEEGLSWELRSSAGEVRKTPPGAPRPLHDRLPAHAAEQILAGARAARTSGELQVFEYEEPHPDDVRHHEVRINRTSDGEVLVMIRDVTSARRAELEAAARKVHEEKLRAQEIILSLLSTPLIPIRRDILVMPLIGVLDVTRAQRVREVLIDGVAARRARIAILDFTGVPRVEAGGAAEVLAAARGVRLVGAEVVITGLQADVARDLVSAGVTLEGVAVHLNLELGVAYAMESGGSSARAATRRGASGR